MAHKFGSFGYAIDYDKQIAEDEALIALLEGVEGKLAAFTATLNFPAEYNSTNAFDVLYAVCLDARDDRLPELMEILGLNGSDVNAALVYMDQEEPFEQRWGAGNGPFRYVQGKLVKERLEKIELHTPAQLKLRLKQVKARRARHIRNRMKNEGR